jgi:phosphate transport system permease protein
MEFTEINREDLKPLSSQKNKKFYFADILFGILTFISSFIVLIILIGIFYSTLRASIPAIQKFGIIDFIFSTNWDPMEEIFSAGNALYGTLISTIIALIIALPVSIGIAIFITELSPKFLKNFISTAIELLAAIPSIIYGMWGLFTFAPVMGDYIEPFLQNTLGKLPILNILLSGGPTGIDVLTAGIILSIMITPFISSIARDTFELTPQVLKESAYGMGSTKWEVIKNIILPHSKPGVYSAVVIAMGRALGETMAVAFVIGNTHQIKASLFEAGTTITTVLANEFNEADTPTFISTLFYLSLILFILNFVLLAFAKFILKRKVKV